MRVQQIRGWAAVNTEERNPSDQQVHETSETRQVYPPLFKNILLFNGVRPSSTSNVQGYASEMCRNNVQAFNMGDQRIKHGRNVGRFSIMYNQRRSTMKLQRRHPMTVQHARDRVAMQRDLVFTDGTSLEVLHHDAQTLLRRRCGIPELHPESTEVK